MGNEQSQEASPANEAGSDIEDDFDLSQIEDTRHDRPPSPPAMRSVAHPPSASPPAQPLPRSASPMGSRKRKAKTKANSKKKRRQSRTEIEEDNVDQQGAEAEAGTDEQQNEDTRLAEEILLREQSQRVRELEPEMFHEYALSEESEAEQGAGREAPLNNGAVETTSGQDDSGTLQPPGRLFDVDLPDFDEDGQKLSDDSPQEESAEQDSSSETPPVDENDDETDMERDLHADSAPAPATENKGEPEASSDQNTAVTSVFDEGNDRELIEETPVPKHNKRKRDTHTSPLENATQLYSNKKRRKDTPPTSPDLDAEERGNDKWFGSKAVNDPTKKTRGMRRQSSMEQFALPYVKGSSLRHPVYNPESPDTIKPRQRIEVVLPMSTAGPSTLPNKGVPGELPTPITSTGTPGLKRRNKVSTPLTAPVQRRGVWDVHGQAEENPSKGLAKTVAKRSLGHGGGDSPGSSSSEHESDGHEDNDGAVQKRAMRQSKGKGRARSASPQPRKRTKSNPTEGKGKNKASQKLFRCKICNVAYAVERFLKKHQEDPSSHDHLHDCGTCDEQFASKAALMRHQKEFGHGAKLQGTTGRFTNEEEAVISRWRDRVCEEHNLNRYEFNEVMTASTKKGAASWPYKFMTKLEFQNEYYDLLPDRDRRSMQRYRHNFQNVDMSREWTEEDDADISRLVAELGPKWVEIGDQLTRSSEAVRQRWKNKLAFGDVLNGGIWGFEERERFGSAVEEVRRLTVSGADQDPNESTFNWTAVSQKVKTRNAKQCADHWRAMNGKSIKGVWVDAGYSLLMKPKTPSKMEKRLTAGELSSKYVNDSDDDEDAEKVDSGPEADEGSIVDGDNRDGEAQAEDTNQGKDADPEREEEGKTPSRKARKPLLQESKTPKQRLTATQAFEGTQARTSEVKSSSKRKRQSEPSQEQPSPRIAIQPRPEPSPEFTRKLRKVLGDESDGNEKEGAESDNATEGRPKNRKDKKNTRIMRWPEETDTERDENSGEDEDGLPR